MLWLVTSRKVPRLIFSAETSEDVIRQLRMGMDSKGFRRVTKSKMFLVQPLTLQLIDEMVKASEDKGLSISDDTSF